ncbi:MAG: hypothetical protein ACI8QZ_004318 [Chlamydiales bacterium]|jgi:hypothetical protein
MSSLTAEFNDVIKGLVLLAFVLGPVLRKLVAGLNDPARRKVAPRRPSPPAGSPAPRGSVTWEELMRGAVPDAPEMPEVEVEPVPAPMTAPPEPSWVPLDSDTFGEVPAEEELERLGAGVGDGLALESVIPGSIGAVGAPTQARELEESVSGSWGTVSGLSRARVLRNRLNRTGWRDGVLLGEILGQPLALREDWSHPGPPLARRPNTQHG